MDRIKIAAGLALIAFVVGFGIARYFEGRVHQEQNRLLVAAPVPLRSLHTQESLASGTDSNQAPIDSEASAPATTSDSSSEPETRAAPDDHDAATALAKLIPNASPHVGEMAQDFKLPDSDGKQVSLSDYRGKVVLLNFWATWCGICQGEMASLESLYREFNDRQEVEFLTVSIDEEGWSKVTPFIKSGGYDFPVLSDPESRISTAYQIHGIPTTFIISRDGRILWSCSGGIDWTDANLKSALTELFAPS